MRWMAIKELIQHYRAVFKTAWQQRAQTDFVDYLSHESEFMPAALALQETPLSPKPRWAMWLIMAFALIGLVWAIFGHVDVVAAGQGKVVPNGHSKVIQPLDAATVTAINVVDGQTVKAGDVLLTLDATEIDAKITRVRQDLLLAQLQIDRANALIEAVDKNKPPVLARSEGVDDVAFLETKSLLDAQYTQYMTQLRQATEEAQGYTMSRNSNHEQAVQLRAAVAMAQRRSNDYKQLVKEGFISEHAYMEKEQERIDQQKDLSQAAGLEKQMSAAIAQAASKRDEIISNVRKVALESLNDGTQKKNVATQELSQTMFKKEQSVVTAPVDGTVQQLAVHTVGGVVTPAQALMVIVPLDNPLEIEVYLANKDVGFVRVGQDVQIKVDAFPYSKYGVVRGKVASLSNDAIVDEKLGLVYAAKISVMPNTDKNAAQIRLSPGLSVTAEIQTDERRVIDYFLSPLKEYQSESLKER
jgi:hemolysin D